MVDYTTILCSGIVDQKFLPRFYFLKMLISLACHALNRAVHIQRVSVTLQQILAFFCHLMCVEFVIVHVTNVFRELQGHVKLPSACH